MKTDPSRPIQPHQGDSRRASLLLSLAVALISVTAATAVPISVSQAEFTTSVNAKVLLEYVRLPGVTIPISLYTNISRTLVSPAPVSDYLKEYHLGRNETTEVGTMHAYAGATSAWSSVSVMTYEGSALGGGASAYAISEMTFSPVTSAVASISLYVTRAPRLAITEGFASLIDLTLDQPLWYYGWGIGTQPFDRMIGEGKNRPEPYWSYDFAGELPLEPPYYASNRGITVDSPLAMDHEYRLVLYTASGASDDGSGALFQVSGLEIPEPTSFSLLALGALALGMRRRRP